MRVRVDETGCDEPVARVDDGISDDGAGSIAGPVQGGDKAITDLDVASRDGVRRAVGQQTEASSDKC
jgi:hypothetical protein